MTNHSKIPYYRDPNLLKLAQGEPCLLNISSMCRGEEGSTTISAHSNFGIHGKGKGIKSSDCYSIFSCVYCHSHLDQGMSMTLREKEKAFDQAFVRQVKEWERIANSPTMRPWKVEACRKVLKHLEKVPFLED